MSLEERHSSGDLFMQIIEMTLTTYPSGGIPLAASAADLKSISAVLVENHGIFSEYGSSWSFVAMFDHANSTIRMFRAPAGGGSLCECTAADSIDGVVLRLVVWGN